MWKMTWQALCIGPHQRGPDDEAADQEHQRKCQVVERVQRGLLDVGYKLKAVASYFSFKS